MTKLLALFRREFIEHRGAFLIAPAVLLAVFTIGIAVALLTNRVHLPSTIGLPGALKLYELSFLAMSQLWWVYLLVTLFFFFADSFSADRRNNAMLFWKSMPVSDFGMLASKMGAGLCYFAGILFGFVVITGIIFFGLAVLAASVIPNLTVPSIAQGVESYLGIVWFNLCQFVLGVLWYAPFFAWVGLLSAVFGRWSIPLAILIPVVLSLLENAAFYGTVPDGGYIYNFVSWRMQFGLSREIWAIAALFGETNTDLLVAKLIDGMDWIQLGGGLVVAAVLVYLASLSRRRGVTA